MNLIGVGEVLVEMLALVAVNESLVHHVLHFHGRAVKYSARITIMCNSYTKNVIDSYEYVYAVYIYIFLYESNTHTHTHIENH